MNVSTSKEKHFTSLSECVCCGSSDLMEYLDLGKQPLANNYHDNSKPQKTYPLNILVCKSCFHNQLSIAINPEILYKNYIYVSGTSKTLNNYFQWFVEKVESEFPNNSSLSVLDIASNDGSLLKVFKDRGHNVLGIDPAENLKKESQKLGVETITEFWNEETSKKINQKFDVVIAMNVLGHVSNPFEFLKACKHVLNDEGRIYIQTSQSEIFKRFEFDTIYHEHISFFTAKSFKTLVQKTNLQITTSSKIPIHGTSYLWSLSINKNNHDFDKLDYEAIYKDEEESGYYNLDTYKRFEQLTSLKPKEIENQINNLKKSGYKIIGYGAAAKGNTVLNYCKLDLDYVIDDNPLKVGKYTPGRNIEIKNSSILYSEDCKLAIVVLAWNFYDEIKENISKIRRNKNDIYLKLLPELICESSN